MIRFTNCFKLQRSFNYFSIPYGLFAHSLLLPVPFKYSFSFPQFLFPLISFNLFAMVLRDETIE